MPNKYEDNTLGTSSEVLSAESMVASTCDKNSVPDVKPIVSESSKESKCLADEIPPITVTCDEKATTTIVKAQVESSSSMIELTVVESETKVQDSNSVGEPVINHSGTVISQAVEDTKIVADERHISSELVDNINKSKSECKKQDGEGSNDKDSIVVANTACPSEEVKTEISIELPSIGILVEDDNAGALSSGGNSNKKDNTSMRKVSAKLSLESLYVDVPKTGVSDPLSPLTSTPEEVNLNETDQIDISKANESATPSSEVEAGSDIALEGAVAVDDSRKTSTLLSPTCTSLKLAPSDIEHKVKRIKFLGKEVPIITQNNNGPCPLLAILNALLLRGEVELGVSGPVVRGGHLVGVVANALIDLAPPGSATPQLLHNVHQNTDDAVQILDKLLTGLDVNVKFSGVQDFEFTNELCVFDGVRVNLYHGWVVDPEWPSAEVVRDLSYNQLTNNILTWRHEADDQADNWLLMKAVLCEEFLHCSSSQLTVHGLFVLGSTMQDEEVAVLFRNNHFSTIYKHKDHLYQLLTDQGFLTEAATWQTLSDVDARFTEFVTDSFEPWQLLPVAAAPSSPPPVLTQQQQINTDKELAAVLQKESDQMCRNEEDFSQMIEQFEWNNGLSDEELARRLQEEEVRAAEEAAAANQNRGGGATAGAPPPQRSGATGGSRHSSPPPSLPRDQAKKKKDQCCIL